MVRVVFNPLKRVDMGLIDIVAEVGITGFEDSIGKRQADVGIADDDDYRDRGYDLALQCGGAGGGVIFAGPSRGGATLCRGLGFGLGFEIDGWSGTGHWDLLSVTG